MKTNENLMKAFTGESEANRKYLAYAFQAENEGYKNIARVFRAIAEGETIHALKHLEAAGKIGNTLENLDDAAKGEEYEYTSMYPGFIEEAEKEEHKKAKRSFELANEAEKVHGKNYENLKKVVEKGEDMEDTEIKLCPVCGWVGFEEIPERCPICGAASSKFQSY